MGDTKGAEVQPPYLEENGTTALVARGINVLESRGNNMVAQSCTGMSQPRLCTLS